MMHNLPRFALRGISLLALVINLCALSSAQQQQQQKQQQQKQQHRNEQDQPLGAINYRLAMPRPVSHLFEVQIAVEMGKGPSPESLFFQMPRWAPGRYAVMDFAKNVQDFDVAIRLRRPDGTIEQKPWPATRVDDQTWRVAAIGPRQVIVVSYKVFADELSGTFSQLDERHANFNGGSIFMYVVGHKQEPLTLTIEAQPGWRAVNSRMESADQREWRFPNYDILMDTPTEIAPDWTLDEFKVDGKTYRVVVHSFGDEGGKRPALVRDIEKIVRAETAMWGPPEFDSYTFLLHFSPDDHAGDGMEHLDSTQIIETGPLAEQETYDDAVDTVAHEFFHVWNVKRLRPVELGPWDFTRPPNTRGLWIAEGLTNYYGHLMQRRAGIWNDAQFLSTLGHQIGRIETSPGRTMMSAEIASLSAPFFDIPGSTPDVQRTNFFNTYVSYYPKGEVLGVMLDLLIRGKSRGRAGLDDVMRRMYREFYLESPNASYYLRGRGYNSEDFERVASQVAGADLSDFFHRYVRGAETPPYDEALAQVGLRLVSEQAKQPYMGGFVPDWDDTESMKIRLVRNNSPAENAGVKMGDVLLSIGDENVTRETWMAALNRYKQGDRVPISLKRVHRIIKTTLTLGPPERYDYRIEALKDATPEMLALRTAWLTGKS